MKHEQAFWGEAFEDAFKKPYLWIYILTYSTYENFRSKSKTQIRDLVNSMMEQRIEWLILFVHHISTNSQTPHPSYYKAYERIATEITSMAGMKQCVKLYCAKTKTFLCTDTPPEQYRAYTEEFIKAIERGIGIGIEARRAFFMDQLSKVEETRDYYLYLLMKEGLATTYSIAGLKREAKNLYDEILAPPDLYIPIPFGNITEEELVRTGEISMEEFRSSNKAMSHLYLRKYIFYCQKKLLEVEKDYIGIGHLSLNFVCTCLGLFKTVGEKQEKYLGSIWVYNHSLDLARYLQEKAKGNPYTDISNNDERIVLHYSVGLMLSLVRSRLQILSRMKFNSYEIQLDLETVCDFSLDRSPVKLEGRALRPKSLQEERSVERLKKSDLSLDAVLETQYRLEEALLILTQSLYENFLQANYPKFAQRYKVEQGILLTARGMYEQAGNLLSSIEDIDWDTLQAVVLLNLLQCYLNTYKYNESVSVALKICRLSSILPSITICRLWKCIENISYINQGQMIAVEGLFFTKISASVAKVLQGDILEVNCGVISKVPCDAVFDRIYCEFVSSKDNGSIVLEGVSVRIVPGENHFKLSGVASAQGKMKNCKVFFTINTLTLSVKVNTSLINIEENTKSVTLIHKVPSLLVFNEVQLLAIEISTRQYPIDQGIIVFPMDTRVLFT